MKYCIMLLCLQVIWSHDLLAQEENASVVRHGTRYVDLRIKSLEKYNSRIKRQQNHLLKKLQRKEKHFAHRLEKSDSVAFARYRHQTISYEFISKLSACDTCGTVSKQSNLTIDSLSKIQSFVQSKSDGAACTPQAMAQREELSRLSGQLNFRAHVSQLIMQRTNDLRNIAADRANLTGLTGIQKQVFYQRSRMNVFKEMEVDPTNCEDEAIEYLQGIPGFDKVMKNDAVVGPHSMQTLETSGADASVLEKMGFQTKQQLQSNLQRKFGSSLLGVSKQVTYQLTDFRKKQADAGELKEVGSALNNLKGTQGPDFRINPMRGLPFMKRLERQLSLQAARPATNIKRPAIVEPAAMIAFKHTPKLSYGLGFATTIGVGENWQNIHLSYEGVCLRTFITGMWQYGLGAYAGYERRYKRLSFMKAEATNIEAASSAHNTRDFDESFLIGVTKTYRISKKYNGAIQLLYDIWWEQKGLQTPFVLRYITLNR